MRGQPEDSSLSSVVSRREIRFSKAGWPKLTLSGLHVVYSKFRPCQWLKGVSLIIIIQVSPSADLQYVGERDTVGWVS
jgi:hypothetical protein